MSVIDLSFNVGTGHYFSPGRCGVFWSKWLEIHLTLLRAVKCGLFIPTANNPIAIILYLFYHGDKSLLWKSSWYQTIKSLALNLALLSSDF